MNSGYWKKHELYARIKLVCLMVLITVGATHSLASTAADNYENKGSSLLDPKSYHGLMRSNNWQAVLNELTSFPSEVPSTPPTPSPTSPPTIDPTIDPSLAPSASPTIDPTIDPSLAPSASPTIAPTTFPTNPPTRVPTSNPTRVPSSYPSSVPSSQPSSWPTQPSSHPSNQPSSNPSGIPTLAPTVFPTSFPTLHPSSTLICQGGTYLVRLPQREICQPCEPGTASEMGATGCTPCQQGTYAPAFNMTKCWACPLNTYQSRVGAASCINCGSGYITGSEGSDNENQCVNPTNSFIIGFICVGIAILVIRSYIFRGRLQRIAFHRREQLIKKAIIAAAATSRAADLVSAVDNLIRYVRRQNARNQKYWCISPEKWEYWKAVFFVIMSVMVILLTIAVTIFFGISQIFFNMMVLYRSYRKYLHFSRSFEDEMRYVVNTIVGIFDVEPIMWIVSPLIYFASIVANFSLDLRAVQVSCVGAQAPGLLLIDIAIVGVVIIMIRSDAQVYWAVAQQKALMKAINMTFNPNYVTKNIVSTVFHVSCALGIMVLPSPTKIIQYSMGFVTLAQYFFENGRSSSDKNCDAAFGVPYDSMLAIITTIFVYIVLPPIIYSLSQVIVPSFKLKGSSDKLFPVARLLVDSVRNFCCPPQKAKKVALNASCNEKEVDENEDDVLSSNNSSIQMRMTYASNSQASIRTEGGITLFLSHPIRNEIQARETSSHAFKPLQEPGGSTATYDPQLFTHVETSEMENKDLLRDDPRQVAVEQAEIRSEQYSQNSTIYSKLKNVFRLGASLLSVDWLYVKGISFLVSRIFRSYRKFLMRDHLKDLVDGKDDPLNKEAFLRKYADDHQRLQSVQIEIRAVMLPKIPWFQALHELSVANGHNEEATKILQNEQENLNLLWIAERLQSPNFNIAAYNVRREMKQKIKLFFYEKTQVLREEALRQISGEVKDVANETHQKNNERRRSSAIGDNVKNSVAEFLIFCTYPASYIFFMHWTTDIGRAIWRRVVQNYISVFTLAFGCWMEFAVDDFNIFEDYENVSHLMKTIDRIMEEEGKRFSVSVTFSMIEKGSLYDKKFSVLHPALSGSPSIAQSTQRYDYDYSEKNPKKTIRLHFQDKGEALVKVLNDPLLQFQRFVGAVVSVRVVLLQLAPILTAFSIIAVEIANCPILVLSKRMNDKLPPLVLWKPFEAANDLFQEDAKLHGKVVPIWKVYCLGIFMFYRRSRAVQFLFLPLNTTATFSLLFAERKHANFWLFSLICLLTIEFMLIGFAYGCYLVLALHRWMFPVNVENISANPTEDSENETIDGEVTNLENLVANNDEPDLSSNNCSATEDGVKISTNPIHAKSEGTETQRPSENGIL